MIAGILAGRPDCTISRTPEAKALGIKTGDPYFKICGFCEAQGVRVLSSNYMLYGDMSARINAIYRDATPDVEVYSIDESFHDLTGFVRRDRVALARDVSATVRAWACIPTCIGIGPTKTLAKLANHVAKTVPELDGICDLTESAAYEYWLCRIHVDGLCGVGRASLPKLEALGIDTAADLREIDPRPVRKALTVVGERMIHELHGVSCLGLELVLARRKGCAVTRSFSSRVTECAELEQVVAAQATRLGEKLRREGLGTDHIIVFYHTSELDRGELMRTVSTVVTLPEATNDALALIPAALHEGAPTWREQGSPP